MGSARPLLYWTNMTFRRGILVITLLALARIPAGSAIAQSDSAEPTSQPAAAPTYGTMHPFVSDTLDGNQIRVPEDFSGKIVLVTFWATWCPKCGAEIPYWKECWKECHD